MWQQLGDTAGGLFEQPARDQDREAASEQSLGQQIDFITRMYEERARARRAGR